jgi:tetratricopeptide (TPR) repeat protein
MKRIMVVTICVVWVLCLTSIGYAGIEEKNPSVAAESIDQLVDLIQKAINENDLQKLSAIKNQNKYLIWKNKFLALQKFSEVMFEAIKNEIKNEKTMASTQYQVCKIFAEIYSEESNSSFLSDKFAYFYNLGQTEKKKYIIGVELKSRGTELCDKFRYDEALDCFQKSLSILREIRYIEGEAANIFFIGEVSEVKNNNTIAQQLYEKALTIYSEIRSQIGEASALLKLGDTYFFTYEYEKALKLYEKSLSIYREINGNHGEVLALQGIGRIFDRLGFAEKSQQILKEAVAKIRKTGIHLCWNS